MRISFNKGKFFYEVDGENSAYDNTIIIKKLTQKNWKAIVSKMEDKIIEKFDTVPYTWSDFTLPENLLTDEIKEKVNRLNILRKYLFYYHLEYNTNEFIV